VIILLLSGPNLDLLGERQPLIYGSASLSDLVREAEAAAATHGFTLEHVHSNAEGPLVDAAHAARGRCAAIIVNGAALTHYGWSLHDALAAFDGPIVELHISNPQRREGWRHTSVIAPVATATIAGVGGAGYRLAVEAVAALIGR
jgi:3-dehydroquinate dehydratase-2